MFERKADQHQQLLVDVVVITSGLVICGIDRFECVHVVKYWAIYAIETTAKTRGEYRYGTTYGRCLASKHSSSVVQQWQQQQQLYNFEAISFAVTRQLGRERC